MVRFAVAICVAWVSLSCGDSAAPASSSAKRTPGQRAPATGLDDLSGLESPVRRAFEAHPEDFGPLPEPGPNDWLSVHPEAPQSVGNFWIDRPNRPGEGGRDTLYIQPLGDVPSMHAMRDFVSDYFSIPVVVRPVRPLDALDVRRRDNDGQEQWLAPEMLSELERTLPDDAYAMIGLTMVDLYPGEEYNFVFGYASTRNRTGVFSLARYEAEPSLATERAFKILAHETGHMFGMHHCVHNACIMNGVNHKAELDRSPLALCPVCLRKLHKQVGFDPASRYEALRGHYRDAGLEAAEAFVTQRLQRLRD